MPLTRPKAVRILFSTHSGASPYNHISSFPIKKYLNGNFGTHLVLLNNSNYVPVVMAVNSLYSLCLHEQSKNRKCNTRNAEDIVLLVYFLHNQRLLYPNCGSVNGLNACTSFSILILCIPLPAESNNSAEACGFYVWHKSDALAKKTTRTNKTNCII